MRPSQSSILSPLFSLLLLSAGCHQIRDATGFITGNNALKNVRKMEDAQFADERREGVYWLSDHDYGRREPYTRRYRQIATNDPDYTVRTAAIRSLNRSRDKQATPIFIKALADTEPMVRTEAAKALANIPDQNAVDPLKKLVADTNQQKDVRIAAAAALRHYHSLDVARTLVDLLDERDFGVAWQSRRSLRFMTGADMRYDEGKWLQYLTGPAKPFG
jgi:hypothetical protein